MLTGTDPYGTVGICPPIFMKWDINTNVHLNISGGTYDIGILYQFNITKESLFCIKNEIVSQQTLQLTKNQLLSYCRTI